MTFNSLTVASTVLAFVASVQGSAIDRRTGGPPAPSCVEFTPFVYAGCFGDPSVPRALPFDSGLNTQNMTVETCVAFCKGNNYKYAGLEYYGECFCGASVNGLAVSETQCNYPCTGDNSETCGGNDILSVYQDPTFPVVSLSTTIDYQPMGCYLEGSVGRALAWRQDQVATTALTVETCLTACKAGGYSFAGVEFGQECYCGVVLGNGTLPATSPSTSCNMPCTGNPGETCGGAGAINLFVAIDMESSQPCNGGNPSGSSSVISTATSTTVVASSSASVATTSASVATTTSVSVATTSSSSVATTSSASVATTSSTSVATTSSTSVATTSSASVVTTSSTSTPCTTSTTVSVPTTTSVPTTSSVPTTTSVPTTSAVPTTTSIPTTTSVPTTTSAPTTTSVPTTTTKTPCSTSTSVSTSASSVPVTTTKATTTTPSLCTSTVVSTPVPTCEYQCGNFCSKGLPAFNDQNSCLTAAASCAVQVTSCFLNAGFPASLNCFKFSTWCSNVQNYCRTSCPGGNCSVSGCKSQNPPSGPSCPSATTSTSVFACSATLAPTTIVVSTTSATVPVATSSNICAQPSNSRYGYSSGSPVGGIAMPCLTCNNVYQDYQAGNCFKLYTSSDTRSCSSYNRYSASNGCQDACDAQYNTCVGTYAQQCNGNSWWSVWFSGYDSQSSATSKCQQQRSDCYGQNSQVSASSHCSSWNRWN